MANSSSDFNYFLALGNLHPTTSDKPVTKDYSPQTSIELEEELKQQFRQIGQEKLWLLIFEDYRVSWGYINEQGWHFPDAEIPDPQYLQELRMFGEKGEFYLWRDEAGFKGRSRIDSAAVPVYNNKSQTNVSVEMNGYTAPNQDLPDYADEWQVLWGTKLDLRQGEWPEVYEARGARFRLPHELAKINPNDELPLRLWVRHYINYDATTGLAYYNDLRLVELRKKNLQSLEWL